MIVAFHRKDRMAKKMKPKQKELPGMENRAIQPLQEAAQEYAEIRDERMALGERESTLKTKVIGLMHEHGKTRYAYDGVTITLAAEETVKVKVKKPKQED